jgi:hypothetical protein
VLRVFRVPSAHKAFKVLLVLKASKVQSVHKVFKV